MIHAYFVWKMLKMMYAMLCHNLIPVLQACLQRHNKKYKRVDSVTITHETKVASFSTSSTENEDSKYVHLALDFG